MDNVFYRTEKGTLYLDDCKEFVEKYIQRKVFSTKY